MNKKDFLCKFNLEDKILLSGIYDKIILAEKIGKPIYTSEFYPPNIWSNLCKIVSQHFCNIKISSYGVFEESERRIIGINLDEYSYYPISLIKITNKSKFSILKHKDYLGALTSIGIKREKFGDLIVIDNCCYAAIYQDIVDFVRDNLIQIGKNPCEIKEISVYDSEQIPTYSFQKINVNVASNRVDCIVSALTNTSRAKANDLIKSGHVLVNYEKILNKSVELDENSVITIRGFGKFKMIEETGWTKSGKTKMCIKKFI